MAVGWLPIVLPQGEVAVPIGLVHYQGLSSGLFAASDSGKPALSRYRVLHRHVDTTLVEVSTAGQGLSAATMQCCSRNVQCTLKGCVEAPALKRA